MQRPTELHVHNFNHFLNDTSFIHGCYIKANICDDLVDYFDMHSDRHTSGESYDEDELGVNPLNKVSTDIYLYPNQDRLVLEEYMRYLNMCIQEYEYRYHQANHMDSYGVTEQVNIQKYEPGEGFKAWHCERAGKQQQTRCLAFMTYLNDVPDGGTEFMYQKIIVPAKRGLTLIWPSDWTHTHRGQISETTRKYIITGWLNYI